MKSKVLCCHFASISYMKKKFVKWQHYKLKRVALSFRKFLWNGKNSSNDNTTKSIRSVVISRVFLTFQKYSSNDNIHYGIKKWRCHFPSFSYSLFKTVYVFEFTHQVWSGIGHRQYHYIFGRRKWLTEWKWCMVSASFNVMNKARDVLMSVFRARDVDLWDIIWFSLFLKMSLTLNKKAIYQQTEEHHQVYISLCNLLGSDSGSHTSKFQPKNWSPQIFTA